MDLLILSGEISTISQHPTMVHTLMNVNTIGGLKPEQRRRTGGERARYVQKIFTRIAKRYNMMNRLMTIGQDLRWRREVICRAAPPMHGLLLDLGAGTGDLAFEALHQFPMCQVIAADFTLDMMKIGLSRGSKFPSHLHRSCLAPLLRTPPASLLYWTAADALNLPFPNEVFDAVVSGFLLRNLCDIPQALSEQHRVLKPGGRLIVLDTTQPLHSMLNPFINLYLHTVIPVMGRLLVGEAEAYRYLPDSIEQFLSAEQLTARLVGAGFQAIGFRRLNFGTIAIHWGTK